MGAVLSQIYVHTLWFAYYITVETGQDSMVRNLGWGSSEFVTVALRDEMLQYQIHVILETLLTQCACI